MICPECGHENLAGAASCGSCGQDLTLHETTARLSPTEVRMLETPVSSLRPRPPVFVAPDCTLADAVAALCANHIGCVLIGTEDDLLGIFSERDALLRTADDFESHADRPIAEFMTPEPETLDQDCPLAFALNRMSVGDFRHLPVTREGRVDGIVSLRDVLDCLSRWYPDLVPMVAG